MTSHTLIANATNINQYKPTLTTIYKSEMVSKLRIHGKNIKQHLNFKKESFFSAGVGVQLAKKYSRKHV